MMTAIDVARVRYQEGQFLGAQDFTDEQNYLVRQRRLHWITAHSWGILRGLEVEQDAVSKAYVVRPGVAVDAWGREIIVSRPVSLDNTAIGIAVPKNSAFPALVNVWLNYCSLPSRPAKATRCDPAALFTRLTETWRVNYTVPGTEPLFDTLGAATEPNPFDLGFIDQMEAARWPLFLGQVSYGPEPTILTPHVFAATATDVTGRWARREAAKLSATPNTMNLLRAPQAQPDPVAAAVEHAGESRLSNGQAVVHLPDGFEQMTQRTGRSVQLTPRFTKPDEPISALAASAVTAGSFTVRAIDKRNPAQPFYWQVKAVRLSETPPGVDAANR